jgi:hypothetical protein
MIDSPIPRNNRPYKKKTYSLHLGLRWKASYYIFMYNIHKYSQLYYVQCSVLKKVASIEKRICTTKTYS